MKFIKTHIRNDVYRKFKRACEDQGISMRQVIISAIVIYIGMQKQHERLEDEKIIKSLEEVKEPWIIQ